MVELNFDLCPLLGVDDDPETKHLSFFPGHRCYGGKEPVAVSREQQCRYCLSPAYRSCPQRLWPKVAAGTQQEPTVSNRGRLWSLRWVAFGKNVIRATASALIVAGCLLLVLTASVHAYSAYAISRLNQFVASPTPVAEPSIRKAVERPRIIMEAYLPEEPALWSPSPGADAGGLGSDLTGEAPDLRLGPQVQTTRIPEHRTASDLSSGREDGGTSFPTATLTAATATPTVETASPTPYVASSPRGQPFGTQPPATWIVIPKIEVDSRVVELNIKMENGAPVWETPNHAVGHYAGTANPGEIGNVAMAGHMRSPVKGEGMVFNRLPELTAGDEVILTNGEGQEFDYAVTEVRVALPTETSILDPTPDETLTLMACVPDWVFSHRLVVTAKRK